jgi:hypothetical protein
LKDDFLIESLGGKLVLFQDSAAAPLAEGTEKKKSEESASEGQR